MMDKGTRAILVPVFGVAGINERKQKKMDNVKVTIGGREIPLRFKMNQFMEIEEEIGNLGEIQELILKGKKRIRNVVTTLRIMGNAGLKAAGEKPDLTDEWLLENMDTYALSEYQIAVLNCMAKESSLQTQAEESEDKERDLVLEEIEQKKDPTN